MLIVLSLYAGVIYLVFGRFKLLPWNGFWKSVSGFVGLIIALVVIGALNYLTPSGRVTVQGAAIAITPNVSGTVVEVAVEANTPVRAGDLLFRVDPEPFEIEVARLRGALTESETAAQMLTTDLESAEAEIEGLQVQLAFGQQRRDDIVELADRGANSRFQLQEAVSTIDQLEASLRAANARKQGLELRIASQIDGVDVAVIQARQALRDAEWDLKQTEIRAPEDGVVTALTLKPGSRVSILNSAVAFVPYGNRALIGVFSQTSAHALEHGAPVYVAMQGMPGEYFETRIDGLIAGTGEGTLAPTGALPTIGQLMGASSAAVRLEIPADLPEHVTRLGSTGTAMRITDAAGPIEPLARILFWIQRYMNYL